MKYSLLCVRFPAALQTCEATFSTLNHVLTPYRQSMLSGRSCNLTIIPFERKTADNIKVEEFLRMFNNKKNRRLQLY